ncbi:MAG TPA: hypothetical protein VF792_12450 [Ktedonobacterales bacterium]
MKSNIWSTTRLLGALLALVAGVATASYGNWASSTFAQTPFPLYEVVLMVPALLIAVVSAWLLKTWWAMLIVPAAYFVGCLVGTVVDVWVRGSMYSFGYMLQYLPLFLVIFGFVYLAPLLIGSAIGTALTRRKIRHHSSAAPVAPGGRSAAM